MTPATCCVCRTREATRLCDHPIARRSRRALDVHTCDAPLCDVCTWEIWNSLNCRNPDETWDKCPEHADNEGPNLRLVLAADSDELRALREEVWRANFCRVAQSAALKEDR